MAPGVRRGKSGQREWKTVGAGEGKGKKPGVKRT